MRLTLLLLIVSAFSFGQKDENGKKHGHIKQYVDSILCPVDSSDAVFYGFEYFDHGKGLFEFRCSKQQRSLQVRYEDVTASPSPSAIDGKVKFIDDTETLVEEHIYKEGHPTYLKLYNYGVDKSYYWTETFYFDSLYENTPGTYFYESENSNGDLVSQGWFRKGPKGWQVYELEEWEDVYMVDADSSYTILKATEGNYKYPYLGENIPPYIGVVLGGEGIAYPSILAGLTFNIADSYVPRKTGGIIGGSLIFKYNIPQSVDTTGFDLPNTNWDPYWGIQAEIGNYSLVTYGAGYSYFHVGDKGTHAFTPFLGSSFYNVQVLISYSFFNRDKNEIGKLRNGRVGIRYVVPIPRKKYMKKS